MRLIKAATGRPITGTPESFIYVDDDEPTAVKFGDGLRRKSSFGWLFTYRRKRLHTVILEELFPSVNYLVFVIYITILRVYLSTHIKCTLQLLSYSFWLRSWSRFIFYWCKMECQLLMTHTHAHSYRHNIAYLLESYSNSTIIIIIAMIIIIIIITVFVNIIITLLRGQREGDSEKKEGREGKEEMEGKGKEAQKRKKAGDGER